MVSPDPEPVAAASPSPAPVTLMPVCTAPEMPLNIRIPAHAARTASGAATPASASRPLSSCSAAAPEAPSVSAARSASPTAPRVTSQRRPGLSSHQSALLDLADEDEREGNKKMMDEINWRINSRDGKLFRYRIYPCINFYLQRVVVFFRCHRCLL